MTPRQAYKRNLSDIRAFGRFAKSQADRLERIAQACRDRQFWKTAEGCPEYARNALRVLDGSMGVDALELRAFIVSAYRVHNQKLRYIRLRHSPARPTLF